MGDPYRRDRSTWNELEELVRRASARGVSSLSFSETERLGETYRLVTAHLSRYRQEGRDPQIVSYLNDLAIRAHGLIYRPTRQRLDPLGFVRRTFPRTVRLTWRYQAVVWAVTLAAAAVAFTAVALDRERAYTLIPSGFYPREMLHALLVDPGAQDALLTSGRGQGAGEKSAFAAYLMTHNTRIGLLAFVSGVLAGVPTILLCLYNGIMLGAFAAVFTGAEGLHPLFLPWILPHGVTELEAIALSATAGLYIGAGVIDPGRLPRGDAVRQRARVALVLMLGAAPMFVAAGLVESFLRQSHLPPWFRLLFAGATAALWLGYFVLGGRRGDE